MTKKNRKIFISLITYKESNKLKYNKENNRQNKRKNDDTVKYKTSYSNEEQLNNSQWEN